LGISIFINHYIAKGHNTNPVAHDMHPEMLWDDQEFQDIFFWTGFSVAVCYGCTFLTIIACCLFNGNNKKSYTKLQDFE
jgi:hypothetical protein